MPSDSSIVRLLYAIISQKCLKDINWEKVAQDPILSQEISNGHAARMRYSRFKKQIEASNISLSASHSSSSSSTTSASRKARKSRIIKSKQQKREPHRVKEEVDEDAAGTSFDSKTSANSARDIQTPEPEIMMSGALPPTMGLGTRTQIDGSGEASMSGAMQYYQPATPMTNFPTPTSSHARYPPYLPEGSPSPSPNSSFNFTESLLAPVDPMYHSFKHHSAPAMNDGLYGELPNEFEASVYDQTWPAQDEYSHEYVRQESLDKRLHDLIDDANHEVDEMVNVKREPRWTLTEKR